MKNKIIKEEKYLEEIGYGKVPIRQLLMLGISSKAREVLLSFFAHSKDWKVSVKQIQRMFFYQINHKRINEVLLELKNLGYIKEENNIYSIELRKIQQDYIINSKIVDMRRKKNNKLNNKYLEESRRKNNTQITENVNSTSSMEIQTEQPKPQKVNNIYNSLYFEGKIKSKIVNEYNQSEYKNNYSFNDFETLYIYAYDCTIINIEKNTEDVDSKKHLLNYLNNRYEYINPIILEEMPYRESIFNNAKEYVYKTMNIKYIQEKKINEK